MQFSIGKLLLLASTIASQPAAACVVNSREIDEWVENGLTRFRVAFSSDGTQVDAYCRYWGSQWCGLNPSNIQCYYNTVVGSWVVDSNWARGPAGDEAFWSCLSITRNAWIRDTKCSTG